MVSSRIDIAAFASNGAQISAPAFFSVTLPNHQRRRYDVDGNPTEIDYRPGKGVYVDPLVWVQRDWADRFDYDARGRMKGWVRTRDDGVRTQFTAHGLRVVDADARGRPLRAEAVRYPLSSPESGGLVASETPTGRFFRYRYANDEDEIGRPEPEPEE